ncbi:Uncharacterised protein [Chromobacterium violaceum]|uniref:Uncharacterized protein n=1 Tax=Chromobacterium violaceum TaxID=536 RepID=A0A3S4LH09_CHRVL|nr:Uncharacterised protein [Chromobacterium violaceum]
MHLEGGIGQQLVGAVDVALAQVAGAALQFGVYFRQTMEKLCMVAILYDSWDCRMG